jgi:Trp operon repressor
VRPRNTQKVKVAYKRLKAVEMLASGMTQIEIAQKLKCSPKTIQRYASTYLSVDSRFPCGLDAKQTDLMRAEELLHLEHYQRQIAQRLSNMSAPTTFAQEAKAVEVASAAAGAYVKLSEQKAKLFGLNSLPPAPPPSITNMLIQGANEMEVLQDLIELKQIANGNVRQLDPEP